MRTVWVKRYGPPMEKASVSVFMRLITRSMSPLYCCRVQEGSLKVRRFQSTPCCIGRMHQSGSWKRVFTIANPLPNLWRSAVFERAEIRTALAYMRLLTSRDSDAAFERVVNVPPRGIGDKTVELLRETARQNNVSLWQAATERCEAESLPGRAHRPSQGFCRSSMNSMRAPSSLTFLAW